MLYERDVRHWIETMLSLEEDSLRLIRARTEEMGLPHEEMFDSQLVFLRCIILALRATKVLELGTYMGYSTVALAGAVTQVGPGRVTTVDANEALVREAQRLVSGADLAASVEFIITDAAAACEALNAAGQVFDFILLDIAETQYADTFPAAVSLLRPGGVLVVDNVLMQTVAGWENGLNVIEDPASDVSAALHDLISVVRGDDRVTPSLIPFGSGLLLCVRAN